MPAPTITISYSSDGGEGRPTVTALPTAAPATNPTTAPVTPARNSLRENSGFSEEDILSP